MAQWSKNFTDITNVNNGQEFGINDYPTTEGFNVPINNTQYLYNLLQNGFIKSYTISNGTVTIVTRDVSGNDTTITMTIDTLNGYTKTEIDDMCVKYISQSLSDSQKTRARLNINAPAAQTSNSSTIANIINQDGTVGIQAESRNDSTKFSMTIGQNDIHIHSEDSEGSSRYDFDLIARLESLGFKQGSFTISNASSITTTKNIIKKQGKRCIANLDVVVTPGTNNIELIVPSDFAPSLSQNVVVIMYSEDLITPVYLLYPTQTLFTISGRKITLSTSGITGRLIIKIFNAGWEL